MSSKTSKILYIESNSNGSQFSVLSYNFRCIIYVMLLLTFSTTFFFYCNFFTTFVTGNSSGRCSLTFIDLTYSTCVVSCFFIISRKNLILIGCFFALFSLYVFQFTSKTLLIKENFALTL